MTTPLLSGPEWGAKQVNTSQFSRIDPEGITAHYGGPSPWPASVDRSSAAAFMASANHDQCASILRAWQAYHLGKGWTDLAYTSGVCPHGVRYQGRPGWARTAAQGTNEGNRRSLAVVYVAGGDDPLTDAAKLGFLDEQARLGKPIRWCHLDWHSTGCPGRALCWWVRAGCPPPTTVPAPPPPIPPVLPPADTMKERVMALPVLRRGSTGHYVRIIQALLVAHAADLVGPSTSFVDGTFGPNTERILRTWQARTGVLGADGVAGPATWAWLVGV